MMSAALNLSQQCNTVMREASEVDRSSDRSRGKKGPELLHSKVL